MGWVTGGGTPCHGGRIKKMSSERAKEDLGFGIEVMDQGHPDRTEPEHRVIGAIVNDFGCCMQNQSPTVSHEMMACPYGDRMA